jgi:hypothetical protein
MAIVKMQFGRMDENKIIKKEFLFLSRKEESRK